MGKKNLDTTWPLTFSDLVFSKSLSVKSVEVSIQQKKLVALATPAVVMSGSDTMSVDKSSKNCIFNKNQTKMMFPWHSSKQLVSETQRLPLLLKFCTDHSIPDLVTDALILRVTLYISTMAKRYNMARLD